MPTRKISERERLTLYARQATNEQLEEALEILRIEARVRSGGGRKVAAKKKPAAPKSIAPKPGDTLEVTTQGQLQG